HHDEPALGLLDINAVKAVPDRPCRPNRYIDQLRRSLIEVEGANAALARGAVGPVLDDLPVAARHPILAHEQRLAAQYADTPIELRRQEFLRQQQVRLFEQLVGNAAEFL